MTLSLHDISIIVVDDSAYMRRIITTMLRSFGARTVLEAEDGVDGIEKIEMNAPDVVVVDWVMPVLDGAEMVRMIRTPSFSQPYVPIIMVSGHSERRRIQEAMQLGVNHFLRKPVSARSLYDRIADCILNPRPFVRTPGYFGPEPREIKRAEVRRFVGVVLDDEGKPVEVGG
ncbi:MAG: response regulator [Hyphomicrobiaceae bacterium]|nr:response regulator [Hyphomicrobiaceae bacterium]